MGDNVECRLQGYSDRFGRQDEVGVLRIGQGPDPNPEDQKSKISALILERISNFRG